MGPGGVAGESSPEHIRVVGIGYIVGFLWHKHSQCKGFLTHVILGPFGSRACRSNHVI